VDILPMASIKGSEFIRGDIEEEDT